MEGEGGVLNGMGSKEAGGARLMRVCTGFEWGSLPAESTVVDVGGGVGSVSLVLAKSFPSLKIVVQDRAEVIEGEAKAVRASPAPLLRKLTYFFRRFGQRTTLTLSALANSFSTRTTPSLRSPSSVPASTCSARSCPSSLDPSFDAPDPLHHIHDWPDPHATTILRQPSDAASPSSRLIIIDHILRSLAPNTEPNSPPFPLLPHLGNTLPYKLDLVRPSLPALSPADDLVVAANDGGLECAGEDFGSVC